MTLTAVMPLIIWLLYIEKNKLMKTVTYITFASMLVMACPGKQESNSTEQPSEVNKSVSVELTPDQIAALKLQSGHITKRNVSDIVQANGYLDVPPQNKAVINPMINGYVRKVNFLVGDNVKKGQTMAELESMDFIDLQQQYLELMAKASFLKEEYDRQILLSEENAISKKKLLTAKADYQVTKATLEGVRSKLRLLGANFKTLDEGTFETMVSLIAPISGSVKKLNIVTGEYVDSKEELFEIVNPDHLHLELSVYEKDMYKVKKGQKVMFQLPSLHSSIIEGEVFLVGQDLSEDKRSINVHVHISGDESNFSVGMYANATIVTSDKSTFTLPITAIVTEGGQKYVFKKEAITSEKTAYHKIPVTTGIESDGFIELLKMDGLGLDDDIVIDGAFYLLNAFTEG